VHCTFNAAACCFFPYAPLLSKSNSADDQTLAATQPVQSQGIEALTLSRVHLVLR
jgi:hypothetical protein